MRKTDVEAMGKLVNHVPDLLRERLGDLNDINMTWLAKEVGVTVGVVRAWTLNRITRRDDEIIICWCYYFGITDMNQIIEYVPPAEGFAKVANVRLKERVAAEG